MRSPGQFLFLGFPVVVTGTVQPRRRVGGVVRVAGWVASVPPGRRDHGGRVGFPFRDRPVPGGPRRRRCHLARVRGPERREALIGAGGWLRVVLAAVRRSW